MNSQVKQLIQARNHKFSLRLSTKFYDKLYILVREDLYYNRSVVGVSHGGPLNSHGTDAESFPSEQETDQLAQSVAMHGTERGKY